MKQHFQKELSSAEAGITIDQWVVLQELHRKDGISQLEIARATYKDAPTITRIIDLLCKKGLTQRVEDQKDRRRFRIKLTPEGHQKIEETLPIIKLARSAAWSGLDDDAIENLVNTLNVIFENLDESSKRRQSL